MALKCAHSELEPSQGNNLRGKRYVCQLHCVWMYRLYIRALITANHLAMVCVRIAMILTYINYTGRMIEVNFASTEEIFN